VGNTLSLYVNDTLLASVIDNGLHHGKIALGVGTYDEGNVEIRFDDLTVKTPSGSEDAGMVLFFEDFSDNDAEWAEGDNESARYTFDDGEYLLSALTDNYLVWSRTYKDWENVAVELKARQVEGPADNEYGIICRYQDADNFYQLSISGDGYYRLVKWDEAEFGELLSWERSSAINEGSETNRLSAICDGSRLSLSANEQTLFDVTDNALPTSGDVGMYVGTFDEGGVTIAFDDLMITNAQ